MDVREEIIKLASNYIGVKDDGPGNNIFNLEYYGRKGGPFDYWCVVYVWYVLRNAGYSKLFLDGGKSASCGEVYNWYVNHNPKAICKPMNLKKGDLVFFRFNNKAPRNHIGFVVKIEGNYITSIDGNTSLSNQYNGGAVMQRRRPLSYVVDGIHLNYEGEKSMDIKNEISNLNQKDKEYICKMLIESLSKDNRRCLIKQLLTSLDEEKIEWADEAMKYCNVKGYLTPNEKGNLRPGSTITRAEIATIIKRMENK